MRMMSVLIVCVLLQAVRPVWAAGTPSATPESAVRHMIELDMAGDADGRFFMAAPGAVVLVDPKRRPENGVIFFELGVDALEVATDWHIKGPVRDCTEKQCVIDVVYRVVASTTGYGNDESWPGTRRIHALPKATERVVTYKLLNVDGKWKIKEVPQPYVAPDALKQYYTKEIAEMEALRVRDNKDPGVDRRRVSDINWMKSQLEVLEHLPQ